MLQKKLDEKKHSDFNNKLIQKITPLFQDLMIDQFGNYLCQKVIEVCSDQQLSHIVDEVLPNINKISINIHGTRSIQTLVDVLSKKLEIFEKDILKIIGQLKKQVRDLSLNVHGNHVIQAFLCIFKSSQVPSDSDIVGTETYDKFTQFIFDACINHCVEIGSHKHGCCVMQRCLEKGKLKQKLELADVIIENLPSLIEDPYGNYLVQNVLKLNNALRNDEIFKMIAKDFIRLS